MNKLLLGFSMAFLLLLFTPVLAVEWIPKVSGFNIYLYENQNLTFVLPWLYDSGGNVINFNQTKMIEYILNWSAAAGMDYSVVQNKSLGDCPAGNYTYGFFQNGTLKCRDDLNTGTGSSAGGGHIGVTPLYNDSDEMFFNYTAFEATQTSRINDSNLSWLYYYSADDNNVNGNATLTGSWIINNKTSSEADLRNNLAGNITASDIRMTNNDSLRALHTNVAANTTLVGEWITANRTASEADLRANMAGNDSLKATHADVTQNATIAAQWAMQNATVWDTNNLTLSRSWIDNNITATNLRMANNITNTITWDTNNWTLGRSWIDNNATAKASHADVTQNVSAIYAAVYGAVQNKSTVDCVEGNYSYGEYQNGTLKCRADSLGSAADWSKIQNYTGVNCSTNNYAYGLYQNGTLQCRADQNSGTGSGNALSPINLTEFDNSTNVLTLNKSWYYPDIDTFGDTLWEKIPGGGTGELCDDSISVCNLLVGNDGDSCDQLELCNWFVWFSDLQNYIGEPGGGGGSSLGTGVVPICFMNSSDGNLPMNCAYNISDAALGFIGYTEPDKICTWDNNNNKINCTYTDLNSGTGGGSALSPINLTEFDNSTGVLTFNKSTSTTFNIAVTYSTSTGFFGGQSNAYFLNSSVAYWAGTMNGNATLSANWAMGNCTAWDTNNRTQNIAWDLANDTQNKGEFLNASGINQANGSFSGNGSFAGFNIQKINSSHWKLWG